MPPEVTQTINKYTSEFNQFETKKARIGLKKSKWLASDGDIVEESELCINLLK